MTDSTRIPLARPFFDKCEPEAVRRVLDSGWVMQGIEVEAFERAVAELHEVKHAVAVSSGTAALHVSFLALGVHPGDLVYVPSFAWPSAANMALAVGAKPVFVDVDPRTYNVDPEDLRRRVTESVEQRMGRPRLVVPVHQFGLPADLDAIGVVAKEFGLDVVEDAACALGAAYRGVPVGSFGRLGILSFHPRKSITTGEGGMILTNDDNLALECRMLRNHGQSRDGKRVISRLGYNYRLTDIQAAIGRCQLRKLSKILEARRSLAKEYYCQLAGAPKIHLPLASDEQTWQAYMVVLDADVSRVHVMEELASHSIETGPGSLAAHRLELYTERFFYLPESLPVSSRLHESGLALPLHSGMERPQARMVADQLMEALRGN